MKYQTDLQKLNSQIMEKDHMITNLKSQIEHLTGDLDNKLQTYQQTMIDHHKQQISQLIEERQKLIDDQRKKYDEELQHELKRTSINHEEDSKRMRERLEAEMDKQSLEVKDLAEKLKECQKQQEVAERTLQVERDQYQKKESQYSIDINKLKDSVDDSNEQRLVLVKELEIVKEREEDLKK